MSSLRSGDWNWVVEKYGTGTRRPGWVRDRTGTSLRGWGRMCHTWGTCTEESVPARAHSLQQKGTYNFRVSPSSAVNISEITSKESPPPLELVHTEDNNPLLLSVIPLAHVSEVYAVGVRVPFLLMNHVRVSI